jgi:hypothetical protein
VSNYQILEFPVLCAFRTIPSTKENTKFNRVSGNPSLVEDFHSNNSIVKHTILEAPVFFIQQYWHDWAELNTNGKYNEL